MPLNVRALALSGGLLWAVSLFLMALTAAWWGWGDSMVTLMSDMYLGYAPGFVGGIIGALWGFVDGMVCFGVFGWLYNRMGKK